MGENDISKMKVADLKKELKNRGLSTLGNKNELVDRLQAAIVDGVDALEDTANSEDLLDDDELNDDILEEEDDKLKDNTAEEDQILKSPTPSSMASKSESPDQPKLDALKDGLELEEKGKTLILPPKKVALKRNISISVPTPAVVTTATETVLADSKSDSDGGTNNGTTPSTDEPQRKVIKLTELSAQERLELRAKKFGPQSAEAQDAKLQARAARFGIGGGAATTTTGSAVKTSDTSSLVSAEALKKRAERFGVSVSDKMVKLEQDEKLIKRQQRFGGSATANAVTLPTTTTTGKIAITASSTDDSSSAASTKPDYAEKARLRLERFKNAA
ncbi:SAP domain-containing ribonucleoprotein [Uranotaenia lowii]|uniref:SAP domain-containing ribonucleoprotein n=1 Tax=Uranotaenia lowii TaxID=190385 RepID=UPI00247AB917|nr:SAP domain-containing ribonucleoprotein [Uranotaenia lowii]